MLSSDVDPVQLDISTPYPDDRDHTGYAEGEPIVRLNDLSQEQIMAFERYEWRKFDVRREMFG